MSAIDARTEFGARALRRLRDDEVIWLTVVDSTNTPRSAPVWFTWDGEQVLIYSESNKLKVRSIEANPRVNLHFHTDERGENVVILTGDARIVEGLPPAFETPAFAGKYAAALTRMHADPAQLSAAYTTGIVITPDRLSGF